MLQLKHIATLMLLGSALKVWQPGEDVLSQDLNANFTYIKNRFVGGQGARLVDADVSPTAAIAQSKIQGLAGTVPKAYAMVPATCNTGTCTMGMQLNISSITHHGSGVYDVNLAYTPTDLNFVAIAQNIGQSGTSHDWQCRAEGQTVADGGIGQVFSRTAPNLSVRCTNGDGANTLHDAEFVLFIIDDN